MPKRSVVTLHAPLAPEVAAQILQPVIDLMEQFGFACHTTVDLEDTHDLTLLVDVPEVWTERGPTASELEHFNKLWERGMRVEARRFAAEGGFGRTRR